jgi:hypothetical protein
METAEQEEKLEEQVVYNRENLRIHDAGERKHYVQDCLEQISDASGEMNNLKKEYNTVTSYLTDMEEIEALPPDMAKSLRETAKHLLEVDGAREQFLKRDDHMTDEQFTHMEQIEEEAEAGIQKLKEAEHYQKLIRSDLKRLDNERHAYQFRQKELETDYSNYKGMAFICFITMIVCVLLLFGLQVFLQLDTRFGYIIAVCIAALFIIWLFVKYNDTGNEIRQLSRSMNRLIQLQNTVKIRYVNNRQLLDYLVLKYHVENAGELEEQWKRFRTEKEDRKKFEGASKEIGRYQQDFLRQLHMARIKDTGIWLHQAVAIVDPKEMVEIRHHLIQRRQSLRSRMDYNKGIAKTAQNEIRNLAKDYPQYADEILKMVSERNDLD